jgi:hypothetical protein
MSENNTLDLAAADVTSASWEDLVQVMMQDELDATSLAGCAIMCGCACACACSSCAC